MAGSSVVGTLTAILRLDAAEFESGMKGAASAAKEWSKDFKKFGQQATQLGTELTKTLTLPIVALGTGAAKAAIDFESAFAGVRKTVDATEPEFQAMALSFRNLAKEIPLGVNELAKLGEAAGALGIPKQDVVEFSRVMGLLGVTTNLTADQAADSIARIQNIFGAAGQDTERLASTLVALGNAGASTETEIVEMGQRIAGAGHSIGLTQAQVLSFASTLASVGINAEAGGSAISRIFLKMNDAVMSGGAALAEFARVAGVSSAQFKESFEKDASQATVLFINGLARLKAEGENTNQTMEGMIGKNIILKDTLNRLTGAGDLLSEQLKIGNKAWTDNTALSKEAGERFKTTEAQLTLLWNRIKDVGITIGNALLPVIQTLVKWVGDLIPIVDGAAKMFAAMPQPLQFIAIGIAGVTAAIGPLIFISGQLAISAAAVTGAFTAQGIAVTGLTAALGAARVAFAALLGPIGIAVTAVVGLGAAVYQANHYFDDLVDGVNKSQKSLTENSPWAKLKSDVQGMAVQIPSAAEAMAAFARANKDVEEATEESRKATEAYKKDVDALVRSLNGADLARQARALTDAYARLTPTQKANADVMERVSKEANDLEDKGAKLGAELHRLAMHHEGVARAAALNKEVTHGLINTTGMYTLTAKEFVKQTDRKVHSLTQFIHKNTDLQTALGQTAYLIGSLPEPPSEAWLRWKDAGLAAFDAVTSGLTHAVTGIMTGATSLKDGLAGIWRSISGAFQSMLDDMLQGYVKKFLTGMATHLTGTVDVIGSGLKSLGTTMLGGLGNIMTLGIAGIFVATLPLIISGVKKLASAIWSGLKSLWNGITGLFQGEGAKTNDVRDQWMQSLGGFEGSREVLVSHGNDAALIAAFEQAYYAGDRGTLQAGIEAFQMRLLELDMPKLASGGIVTSPTMALIGESGPEAVVPLDSAVPMRPLILQIDGRTLGRVMFNPLAREAARMQVTQA